MVTLGTAYSSIDHFLEYFILKRVVDFSRVVVIYNHLVELYNN